MMGIMSNSLTLTGQLPRRTIPHHSPYRFWSWWVVLFRVSGPSVELSWWGIVLWIVVLVGNGWALFLSGGELSSWGVVLEPNHGMHMPLYTRNISCYCIGLFLCHIIIHCHASKHIQDSRFLRTGNGSSSYVHKSNRVVFIVATRVAYLAKTVIKSHYFVGLESAMLIA